MDELNNVDVMHPCYACGDAMADCTVSEQYYGTSALPAGSPAPFDSAAPGRAAHESQPTSTLADVPKRRSISRNGGLSWRRPTQLQRTAECRADAQLLQCLAHFVGIRTVSGDPELHEECFRGAKYVAGLLEGIGMQVCGYRGAGVAGVKASTNSRKPLRGLPMRNSACAD